MSGMLSAPVRQAQVCVLQQPQGRLGPRGASGPRMTHGPWGPQGCHGRTHVGLGRQRPRTCREQRVSGDAALCSGHVWGRVPHGDVCVAGSCPLQGDEWTSGSLQAQAGKQSACAARCPGLPSTGRPWGDAGSLSAHRTRDVGIYCPPTPRGSLFAREFACWAGGLKADVRGGGWEEDRLGEAAPCAPAPTSS